MRSLTGSASPRSSSARPSPNSSIPRPNYAASAPLRRATPQHGPSVITVVPLWPLLLRRTRPRSRRRPVPRRRLALRRVTHRAPQPPDGDPGRSLRRRPPVRRAPPLDSPVKHHSPEEANVPEYYSSIGDAVGAAMQHNIRLAHRSTAPGSDKPLQVRHLPSASADPYSVRGMISRLHEDASPDEVAGIIEEVNGALVGALPELTELVASAADWTRARLDFDDPHHNPTFETWTRLAAAYGMLQDVREQLEVAEDGLAACPAERTAPRHHQMVNVLRSRELLDDVLGAEAAPVPSAARNVDSDRQRAARASSPRAGTSPSTGSPPATAAPPPAPRSAGRPR